MRFLNENGALVCKRQGETLRIEAWGKDSLRVRATMYPKWTNQAWALTETPECTQAEIEMGEKTLRSGDGTFYQSPLATIRNGRVSAVVNHAGVLTF